MDEVLKIIKINLLFRCRCCEHVREETVVSLFITGNFSSSIWTYYASEFGLHGPFIQVQQAMKKWWDLKSWAKLYPIYQTILAFVSWQLRKKKKCYSSWRLYD